MDPQALANSCAEVINWRAENSFPVESAVVSLVTPQGWKRPPRFPRGTLLQVKENGDRLWHFKAMNVLAWLAANNLAKVEIKSLPRPSPQGER